MSELAWLAGGGALGYAIAFFRWRRWMHRAQSAEGTCALLRAEIADLENELHLSEHDMRELSSQLDDAHDYDPREM